MKRLGQRGMLAVALAATVLCPARSLASSGPPLPEVLHPNVLISPGPQPRLDVSDYVPYRMPGNGIVVAPIIAHFANRSALSCSRGDTAVLYPATPYVLWALRSWLAAIDDKPDRFPFPDSFVSMPKFLALLGTESILPSGDCDAGDVVFRRVPPGRYYLVVKIWRTQSESGSVPAGGYDGHTEMTPAGLQSVYVPNGPNVPRWKYLDGYVMTANEPLEVRDGYVTNVAPEAIHPAAHILTN